MDWAAVAVVAILVWGGVKAVQAKYGIISDEDGNETRIAPSEKYDDSHTKAEITELRDRVKVLERLVTDRGFSLADEIEALRDTPSPSASDAGVPLNLDTKEKA